MAVASASVSSMNDLVRSWLGRFTAALADLRPDALEGVFAEECFWRDLVAFTWNIKTAEGRDAILDMAAAVRPGETSSSWALKGDAEGNDQGVVEAWLSFETEACSCVGHVRLRPDGRCWTLMTAAQEIKGHPDPSGPNRIEGRSYGAGRGRESFSAKLAREKAEIGASENRQPYVVIVGGGQCGLAIGARLTRLGVPNVILDKNPRAGDCWRSRYECLHLHDPVFANHLPHLPLPDNWPLWPHKDQMADWLEVYAKAMDLNYWGKSACTAATWDEGRKEWLVKVDRDGQEVSLKPKHLILATGLYGGPFVPELEGREHFQGEVLHASEYKSAAGYAGKRVVVVGTGTSAHDIMEDLWEHGAQVLMVQRSASFVTPINTQLKTVFPLYDDEAQARGITTEMADLTSLTFPFRVVTEGQKARTDNIRAQDAGYYRRLEEAGFRLDFGEDDTGNIMMFLRRGSGYYFDTGASELIMRGEVEIQQGDVRGFAPGGRGVVLRDGAEVDADVVVLATGYQPLNEMVARFLGKDLAEKMGRVWGLGSGTRGDPGPWEGELRNMWKPTTQEGLWVQGGNLGFSRIYSKYLALQLQARYLGLPTPTYGAPTYGGHGHVAAGGC